MDTHNNQKGLNCQEHKWIRKRPGIIKKECSPPTPPTLWFYILDFWGDISWNIFKRYICGYNSNRKQTWISVPELGMWWYFTGMWYLRITQGHLKTRSKYPFPQGACSRNLLRSHRRWHEGWGWNWGRRGAGSSPPAAHLCRQHTQPHVTIHSGSSGYLRTCGYYGEHSVSWGPNRLCRSSSNKTQLWAWGFWLRC